MVSENYVREEAAQLANENLPLARQIAGRLRRWYGWVCVDDLHSYAYLGVALAARAYEDDRGVPFVNFAAHKGMYLAIDEMRKDGVLKRRRATSGPTFSALTPDISDPSAEKQHKDLEGRDLCALLLGKLSGRDRKLLLMYYADDMTFREIAKVFGISESAVCLRHKALLSKLRKLASVKRINQ